MFFSTFIEKVEYGIIRRKGCRRHPTVARFASFRPEGLNTRVPLIINNFYDEYNGDSLYFSNLLFLGITLGPINLLNFKMENGKLETPCTMSKQVKTKTMVYGVMQPHFRSDNPINT